MPENKVYKWNDLDGLSTYITPSGHLKEVPVEGRKGSNGLAFDANGDLNTLSAWQTEQLVD